MKDSAVEILDSFPSAADAFGRLSVLEYAPPIGTGRKVKVLEAMAYGVPTVVNSEGFEGLEADAAPPVRVGNSDEEIVDHVLNFLHDDDAREQFAEEGRHCIARSFSPGVVAKALLELFRTRKKELRS